MSEHNRRELEAGIERDLENRLSYAGYLHLDTLLSAQQPVSQPAYHDEMLFIVQHQVAELWMKLAVHELGAALRFLREDRIGEVLKVLARFKQVQHQLYAQWGVLETMTPYEYLKFRDQLGPASGFQSLQYRTLEFLLGNKHADMLEVFAHDPKGQSSLRAVLEAPGLYDEALRWLARKGHAVPQASLERDWSGERERDPGLVPVFERIYRTPQDFWPEYHLCETLVDIEENFQLWRFRHMKTVQRIIGQRAGTGGSSGVAFLKQALDLTFFPELLEMRAQLG
ncbi:tryptophan 2,3-dioxygenase family protein [Oleiagrimonas sp.]|jgi:tryptophan 2,3-dioxygenase|uniref:tryptophan 2,3-dioxygenase n=1 Tax=Oleiagrimonas sp. TaxID=2010330 RepID=UPI0026061357|nr:tryptophan 2,3-dioxygenase family protein [Oleiagrimonas sp.]MDA3914814.1 tryptophan 2,3-dioxygenase family protein [Oleiagrimonas sp.]